MYGCRTLEGVLGKLQTEKGNQNAATTAAIGNVDAESCLEDEVPLLGRIPGVISVCLGRLRGGTSCRLRPNKANWDSGEVHAIAVGAEAPLNDPAVVLQHVRSSRRMRWPVPAVGGAGTAGDFEVVQDIRGLVSKIGQGPAALTRDGTGERANRGTIESKREHFSQGVCPLGLNNGRGTGAARKSSKAKSGQCSLHICRSPGVLALWGHVGTIAT